MSATNCQNAILCAGQGAQFVGMGRDIADAYPACKNLFSKANDVLGYDLTKICFEGPEKELLKSNHCQPAIFVVSVACFMALFKENITKTFDRIDNTSDISATAGLSLGEWSALYIAEALSFEDTIRILEARGRYMQEACEERDGAMLSVIGLPVDQCKTVAENAGVEIANINSPMQTVLSGERERIQEAEKLATGYGAKRMVILKVAGAYHSSLMVSAAKRLECVLKNINIQKPRVPVVSNVTGRPHDLPDDIRRNMVLQVTSPVQWISSIQWLQQHGVTQYIECGPGRVLSGLVKRIQPDASLCRVQDIPTLKKTISILSS